MFAAVGTADCIEASCARPPTRSSNPRALSARELAERARARFGHVEVVEEPSRAVVRGRELAGAEGALLVTGSLYLLADLFAGDRSSSLAT